MKTFRFVSAFLMLVSGIWHIELYVNSPAAIGIGGLAFGILYVITGLLLFTPKMIGAYLGLIPLIPLIMAPFVLTRKDLEFQTITILLIDLVVFVCCLILVLKRKKIA